jgi:arylsulfatase A-like enzyme
MKHRGAGLAGCGALAGASTFTSTWWTILAQLPFFAFVHSKSVHAVPPYAGDERRFPYDKPEPYRSMFLSKREAELVWKHPEYGEGLDYLWGINESIAAGAFEPNDLPEVRVRALRGQYDSGVYYTDYHFGRILKELDEQGIADDTVIIVTSDHGEAFLEHNLLLHREVYSELVRVPLIVFVPGDKKHEIIEREVTLLDIVPTILDVAGVDPQPNLEGRSLLQEPRERSGFLFFSYFRNSNRPHYEGYSLRDPNWTLIHQRLGVPGEYKTELYDRRTDPLERNPIHDRPEVSDAMMGTLTKRLQTPPLATGDDIVLDRRAIEHLRALGYLK